MNSTKICVETAKFTVPAKSTCRIKHNPIKRCFDILFSMLVLLIGAPIFFVVSLFVIFSSKGKVVYSHERVGRGGKKFRCYKFRTMYNDADKRLKNLLEACPKRKKEWDVSQKLKNDPRITRIGAFLRKTSLDEFPQFWNVLKGDLSVVGPRPVVQSELAKHYGVKATTVLSVRPGLTGIWQVSGRNDTSYNTRVELDEKYVKEGSMALDLKLIAKTIPTIISSKGAY